jgi:hypothetical protein
MAQSTEGTYTAEGITAIAGALCVNGSLTKLNVKGKYMGDDGEAIIRKAVEGREGFVLEM